MIISTLTLDRLEEDAANVVAVGFKVMQDLTDRLFFVPDGLSEVLTLKRKSNLFESAADGLVSSDTGKAQEKMMSSTFGLDTRGHLSNRAKYLYLLGSAVLVRDVVYPPRPWKASLK